MILGLLLSLQFMVQAQMPSSEWRARMLVEFSDELCSAGAYFPNCYTVSANTCQKVARQEFSSCLRAERMPAQIDPLTEGVRFSARLGRCVGDRLEAKFKSGKNKQEECQSAYNWD